MSTPPDSISDRQLDAYLSGTAPPHDAALVETWIARDPSRAALLAVLRTSSDAMPSASDELAHAAQRVVARLDAAIGAGNERTERVPAAVSTPPSRRPIGAPWSGMSPSRARWPWLGFAAAAAVIGLVVGTRVMVGPARHDTPRAYRFVTTHNQDVARLTLDDGTQVTLAPNSTLGIARDFPRHRELTLSGEAYFDVTRHTDAPFLVRTGTLTTRVLGTTFDVRHYNSDGDVRVAVTSGKVALSGRVSAAGRVPIALTVPAGMVARVTDSTTATASVPAPEKYTTWRDGTLSFERASVGDILSTVGHWYGYEFHLQDSTLALGHYTLELTGESSAVMLRTLGTVLNVTMTFDGHVVTLAPRRTAGPAAPRRDLRELNFTGREVGR